MRLRMSAIRAGPSQADDCKRDSSPGDQLYSYLPSSPNRQTHDTAVSTAAGMYSKDRDSSGRDRPRSTSSSAPSTSILQKVGVPCRAMSSSSVLTRTEMSRSQLTP